MTFASRAMELYHKLSLQCRYQISFRLTCTQINNAVPLRIDRVFLSANPLNIEVFRKIASHEKFRHSTTEVIWVEARLPRGPQRIDETAEGNEFTLGRR